MHCDHKVKKVVFQYEKVLLINTIATLQNSTWLLYVHFISD